ncbi:glycine betaine ABC transporter substrate-binding protein [Kytococcus sp. Marseille-QA3725]
MSPHRELPRRLVLTGFSLAALAPLAGCGLGTAGGHTPSGALQGKLADIDLTGAEVAVGSKNFTEQVILGKMTVEMLRSAGAKVADYTDIPGSTAARQALVENQVQLQWEYTGTAWISYLGETEPIADEDEQFEAVRRADRENGLVWMNPAPMNNTYAFATRAETAEKLGIKKSSELAGLSSDDLSFCVNAEFAARDDGFDPWLAEYGLADAVSGSQVSELDTGAVYEAIDSGRCTLGVVFATDGRLEALDLQVVEDDKDYFPKYNAALVVTEEFAAAHPEVEQLFAPLSKKLTDDALMELNAQVDVEGRAPAEVAWEWLLDQGFVTEA